MSDTDITDDRLAALADGELTAGEERALRDRIAADPRLAERFALFVETRALLAPKHAQAGATDAGLARLEAAIRAADATRKPRAFRVVEGGAPASAPAAPRAAAARPRFRSRAAWPALAASVALVVGGLIGYAAGQLGDSGQPAGGIVALAGPPGAEAALASALERSKSGEPASWSDAGSGLSGAVTVIASHRLKDGRLCREYETHVTGQDVRTVGLGCRASGGGWRTEIAARATAPNNGYGAASAANLVENAIAELGGAGPLPERDEQALLASGWKAQGR